jgi:hypothetical protein
MRPTEKLREIRRGDADLLELVTTDGAMILLHAHGVHLDEQVCTKERALKVLCDALRDAPAR